MNDAVVVLAFVVLIIFTTFLVSCAVSVMIPEPQEPPEQEQPADPPLTVRTVYDVPMPQEHQEIVRKLCAMFDLDERLVYGVIFAESNFDNAAVNEETGCFGYMQLNPDFYIPEWFIPPSRNLYAGIKELARLNDIYQDTNMVLLCYNNGESGAHRLIAQGITSTDYTRKVIAFAESIKVKGRIYEESR